MWRGLALVFLLIPPVAAQWEPPAKVTRPEIISMSKEVLARPDIPITVTEDLFRFSLLKMDWDGAGAVYQPRDPSRIPVGPDGKKIGVFLIHGGSADQRAMDEQARLLAGKFGFKVVTMTYPGHYYLPDKSRDWPGDVLHADGSLRTPIWNKDKLITRDQYDVVEEKSMRPKYGTILMACAKEGTEFYHRMAAHPMAFEETGKSLMSRHLPPSEYSIYIHGHSTGGPYSFMFSQRVANIAGVIGMESSPFGVIYRLQSKSSGNPEGKTPGDIPFNCLQMFDWRLTAMLMGDEALMEEGPQALARLPMLMEEVFEAYEQAKKNPRFKSEGPVHFGGVQELAKAAKAVARRLDMGRDKEAELVEHFVGYARELQGPNVKPVPPIILAMTAASASHLYETYKRVTAPMFAAMNPPPKVRLVPFEGGIHGYTRPEPELPLGMLPAVAKIWHDAIMNGYYAAPIRN